MTEKIVGILAFFGAFVLAVSFASVFAVGAEHVGRELGASNSTSDLIFLCSLLVVATASLAIINRWVEPAENG